MARTSNHSLNDGISDNIKRYIAFPEVKYGKKY